MRVLTVFADTSGLFSVLDEADRFHEQSRAAFSSLLAEGPLTTHNYVVVETVALVQRRLGIPALAALRGKLLPVLRVVWVDEPTHAAALAAVVAAARRDVSFVDQISFEVMRRRGLQRAFALDRHFEEQGFELIPDHAPA